MPVRPFNHEFVDKYDQRPLHLSLLLSLVEVFLSAKRAPRILQCAMSLLDQLWDDTVAGPRPDKGLGKLRKHSTFSFRSSNSGKEADSVANTAPEDPSMKVTRSIMIVKPERTLSETPPASPAGSTPPVSPFGGSRSEAFRFRRKSTTDTFEKATGIGTRSPRAPYEL